MDFVSAIHFIEFSHAFGTRIHLNTMKQVLHKLGNPHQRLSVIHVAGTNGKGSTSSYLSSMLMAQGYRTGLFTSPHMHCYSERIRVNNVPIAQEDFVAIFLQVQEAVMPLVKEGLCPYPAMFDWMTLIGFVYFDRMLLDAVVLEVGLGGLEDATNVIDAPLAAVITPIDIDHVDVLGAALSGIAAHKAGIIKANCPVISHYQLPEADLVIRQRAAALQAPLYFLEPHHVKAGDVSLKEQAFDLVHPDFTLEQLSIRMMGDHQINNASLATLTLMVLHHLGRLTFSEDALRAGLQQSFWAGRLEVVSHAPMILIDGAHNLQGAEILETFLTKHFTGKKINFVVGMLNNKDADGVLSTLMPLGNKLIFTRPNNPKAVDPLTLSAQVEFFGKEVYTIDTIPEAVETAVSLTSLDEILVITGSLYLVGDAKAVILQLLEQKKEAS